MARYLFLVVVLATFWLSPAALARTWIDIRGNKMNAKFVRIHEGDAIFSRAGRVVKVPFSDLTPEDQDYIRRELTAKGQEHQLPITSRGRSSLPGLSPVGGVDAEDAGVSPDPPGGAMQWAGGVRTWTDARGRTMEAQFVGLEGDKVVLLKDGRRVTYPLSGFSQADQAFIRAQAGAGGQGFGPAPGSAGFGPHPGSGMPPGAYPGSAAGGMPGGPMGGYGDEPPDDLGMEEDGSEYDGETGPGAYPRPPGPYSGAAGSSGWAPRNGASPPYGSHEPGDPGAAMPEMEEESTSYGSHPPHGSPGSGGAGAFPSAAPAGPDFSGPPHGGYPGSRSPGSGMGMPVEVQIKYCTKCKGELSMATKIGDTCPHCGIKFIAQETADGRMVDARGREVSWKGSPVVTFTGIGAVVGAVIGILVKLLQGND